MSILWPLLSHSERVQQIKVYSDEWVDGDTFFGQNFIHEKMSVFLNNLDDFILPSQGCINPFVLNKKSPDSVKSAPAKITLQSDFSTTEYERPQKPDLIKLRASVASKGQKVAAVSLNDCLACSGCVTSAETVLIQEQSYHKLYDRIKSHNDVDEDIIVVCLSPQSIASIAAFTGTCSNDMFLRVASVIKSLGVKYVLDTSSAGDVALIESREEFLARYQNGRSTLWEKPPHTVAASSSTVFLIPETGNGNRKSKDAEQSISLFGTDVKSLVGSGSISNGYKTTDSSNSPDKGDGFGNDLLFVGSAINGDQALPMLASQCPGWVCYAEKTQPQSLPFISHTKSPQQILGAILKDLIFKSQVPTSQFSVKSVYVVSVQPCFDKKLESSRKDFYHSNIDSQEVDLVISTTELWSLIEEQAAARGAVAGPPSLNGSGGLQSGVNVVTASTFDYLKNVIPDSPFGRDEIESLFRSYSSDGLSLVAAADSNSSSGGYLEHIFRYAAERIAGVNLWGQALQYTAGRNIDVCEVSLCSQGITGDTRSVDNHSQVKLKFGKAYGFRNIQSVMLKMKQGKCDLDFIEIMACPSGCNNGGGQLKVLEEGPGGEILRESISATAVRVRAVEDVFHSMVVRRVEDSPLVQYLYSSTSYSADLGANIIMNDIIIDGHETLDSKSDDKNPHKSSNSILRNCAGENSLLQCKQGVLGCPISPLAMDLLHTRYHSVPKLELLAPLAAKW